VTLSYTVAADLNWAENLHSGGHRILVCCDFVELISKFSCKSQWKCLLTILNLCSYLYTTNNSKLLSTGLFQDQTLTWYSS